MQFFKRNQQAIAAAAVTSDGLTAIYYVLNLKPISINTQALAMPANAIWFDPTNGSKTPANDSLILNTNAFTCKPPDYNAANGKDWVLVISSTKTKK